MSISCNEILPNLIVGNAATAKNSYQFDLIINCTKNINYNTNAVSIRIPIDDLPEDSDILLSYLPSITEKIHEFITNDKKVLVHCSMGVSRSCTVVAAYIIRYNKVTIDQVISFIKEKRKEAFFIDVRFRNVLERFLEFNNRF